MIDASAPCTSDIEPDIRRRVGPIYIGKFNIISRLTDPSFTNFLCKVNQNISHYQYRYLESVTFTLHD